MSQGTRRLAAIMFTDMVGYTALGQKNEALSLALVEEQRRVIRPILERHNGREVKVMGDAFMVEFPNSLEAVRCAYDIQRGVREFNFSIADDRRLHLRIGIHLGDVVESMGDISGDAVNLASRIEPLAEDGGVCVTREVYVQVANKIDLQLKSMGARSLKNVVEPVDVYRLVLPWEAGTGANPTQLDTRRVAVLPFANFSPDPGDEYFSDGMTEELITRLSEIRGLSVIARTSVMSYKKKEKNVSDIARELKVGSIVEGSVRKAANKVRITVQLIDARDESHVWAANYDRTLEDIFAIQSDVSSKVAESLTARVLTPPKKDTEDLQAYTWYLRANQLSYEPGRDNLREARTLLEKAVSRDPKFVRAYAALAHLWGKMAVDPEGDIDEMTARQEEAARKALEIDPDSAEAHAAMSELFVTADRHRDAIEEAETAIRINPNLAVVYEILGTERMAMGDAQGSSKAFERAQELDPLSLFAGIQLADALSYSGKRAQSLVIVEQLMEAFPGHPMPHVQLARLLMRGGELAEAQQAIDTAKALAPEAAMPRIVQGTLLAMKGDRKGAEGLLAEYAGYKNDFMRLMGSLEVNAVLGNDDKVFELLSEMGDRHLWFSDVLFVPMLERMRKDPRFTDFCKKVGIPPP